MGAGRPEDFTLAELKELDAGSWSDPRLSWDRKYGGERLITLDELLDAFGPTLTYHVELKKPMAGLVERVIQAVKERDLVGNVFICAIENEADLKHALELAPDIRIAWAPEAGLRDDGAAAVRRCAANGFAMITLNSRNQSRALVELAHSLGMEARSSGIGSREQMVAAAELGCNGMTINWPDWLIDYVRRRDGMPAEGEKR